MARHALNAGANSVAARFFLAFKGVGMSGGSELVSWVASNLMSPFLTSDWELRYCCHFRIPRQVRQT